MERKKRKLRLSIRFQYTALVCVVLIMLLTLLNTYPLISSRDTIFSEKETAMSRQASVVASALSSLDELTEQSVEEVLKLLDVSGIDRIAVTDHRGVTVYDSADHGAVGRYSALSEVKTACSGKVVFRSRFEDSAFISSFATPMSFQGAIHGIVFISEYDSEQAGIILAVQSRIRTISVTIGVAAILLVSLFSILLTRRIRELSGSMKVVADGNYSYRMTPRGNDELTELGDEFNALTERLENTEQQRRRFVSDASHELKTPLASIMLLSDSIVQNDMDKETMREFVTDIGSEAERLRRTTEKLLDLSRLDDNVQIVPEPVDIKQVCIDALAPILPIAEENDVKIRCDLADGCVVMATADDMFHIMFNLIENAVKYNVPGGSVRVTSDMDEDKVHITVADTGIGIPEEDRLNIFSRFYRVDKARSREAGGSGLGLSIVHDAVTAHGGTIAVGQNIPQGSLFIVTFPQPTSEETGI